MYHDFKSEQMGGGAEECQTSINELHVKIFKESLSHKNTGLKAKTNFQV